MLKGLGEIQKKTEQTQAMASQDRIKILYVGAGETAVLRFLTDKDEVISAPFHNVEEMTPNGKKYRKKYCTMAEKNTCIWCSQANQVREYIFLWSYVSNIFHKVQNPALEGTQEAQRWERVKVGPAFFYKEAVNGPMIFRMSPGKGGTNKSALIGFANEYEGLCDREYKWSREGAGRDDTKYTLTPKDKTNLEDLSELISKLPLLSDVVTGKIKSFSQEEGDKPDDLPADGDSVDTDQFKNAF